MFSLKTGKLHPALVELMKLGGIHPVGECNAEDAFHLTQKHWLRPELSRFTIEGPIPTPTQFSRLKELGLVDGLILHGQMATKHYSELLILGAPVPEVVQKRIDAAKDAAVLGATFGRIALVSGRVPIDRSASIRTPGKFYIAPGREVAESCFHTEDKMMSFLWNNGSIPEDWPNPVEVQGEVFVEEGVEYRPTTETTLGRYFSIRTRNQKEYKVLLASNQPFCLDQYWAGRLQAFAGCTVGVIGLPAPMDTPLSQFEGSIARLLEKMYRHWQMLKESE